MRNYIQDFRNCINKEVRKENDIKGGFREIGMILQDAADPSGHAV
jgi:hypothetical protein